MELQEPAAAKMVGLHIPLPPSEPMPPWTPFTTFEGVHLSPEQLKELKALTAELDEQRSIAMVDED